MPTAIDSAQVAINAIRTLSMDAVQKANSGHPGTPMALAPVTYALWNHHLKYDPQHPNWMARDRFVLSCGHSSMLLYSILHLAGVKQIDDDGRPTDAAAISIDDIKNFRQLHARCAGHPEHGFAEGIETTTGPLGQGCANSVGMAAASRFLTHRVADGEESLLGFNVYVLCSDGDIMEGVAQEAASFAGHQKLSNLCWIYDDNNITIEGSTDLAFTEDTAAKYTAMGWHVQTVSDANDLATIDAAMKSFQQESQRPTLIVLKSVIGYGAPTKQGTHGAHGAPLGEEEISGAKQFYGWDREKFDVPAEAYECFANELASRGAAAYAAWETAYEKFRQKNPTAAEAVDQITRGELPSGWDRDIPQFEADEKGLATRVSSGKVLNAIAGNFPWLIGGSADLAGSNKSDLANEDSFLPATPAGRNFHFGIREHAMAAICNGMALCHLRAYGATFFVFTDYMRPSMRLAALMKLPVLYLLTHDSIGLGEDGPTHQPVEHLAACRAIPNLLVFRPGDANEVAHCYRAALQQADRPSALVLSRQNLPTLDRNGLGGASDSSRGGYTLLDAENPDVILIASGSEVPIALAGAKLLSEKSIAARVVSMPCFEIFDEQDAAYRESVLPSSVSARVAVEAGLRQGWDKYIGTSGGFVGMTGFGESAPAEVLYNHFGITAEAVVKRAEATIQRTSQRTNDDNA